MSLGNPVLESAILDGFLVQGYKCKQLIKKLLTVVKNT